MKLLRLINSANPEAGGPIEGATQIDRILRGLGNQVTMVTLDNPSSSWLKAVAQDVIPLGPGRGNYGYSKKMLSWLNEHVSEYDVVIVNGLWQFHGCACWRALRQSSIPYFVFPHGMLDPWFKERYPLKHLKKMAYWMAVERHILKNAAGVLFTSNEERISARRSFSPYQVNEILLGYGTAKPSGDVVACTELFLRENPELQDKRRILFLGRLHPKKGCDLLIQAFAALRDKDPRLHLMMAGPDQVGWKGHLEAMALKLGVSNRITWLGMLKGERKLGALASAEIFTLPSHQENFGIAVAEALAVGTPVLISNKVNIWQEVVADGAGFVGDDDIDGTKECLFKWLELSPEEQKIARIRALLCFTSRFEIDQVVDRLVRTIAAAVAQ